MHKFLGIQPPPTKKQKISDSKTKYETSRKRSFQSSWSARFTWVSYEKDTDKMFCSFCCKYDESKLGTFVVGCQNFRVDSLNAHANSESHIKCALKKEACDKTRGPWALMRSHEFNG